MTKVTLDGLGFDIHGTPLSFEGRHSRKARSGFNAKITIHWSKEKDL